MKDKAVENILENLLIFELPDRIKKVEKDVDSKKDKYASIDPMDLAKALEIPLNAIDGGGGGEWTEWLQYGYRFIKPFKENSKSYGIDEMLELLEIEIPEERYEFLQQKYSELSERKVINLLTDDEKNLISLKIALKALYDEDGDRYSCMAKTHVKNSDLWFEASLNGDYHTIDNLKTPYHLRDEVAFSEIWFERAYDNRAFLEKHFMNKNINTNEVWIEAYRNRGEREGEVVKYLEYLRWIKEHLKGEPDIVIYRCFNDE